MEEEQGRWQARAEKREEGKEESEERSEKREGARDGDEERMGAKARGTARWRMASNTGRVRPVWFAAEGKARRSKGESVASAGAECCALIHWFKSKRKEYVTRGKEEIDRER